MRLVESPGKVVSIELSTIAHATESLDKVETAILNVLPTQVHDSTSFCRHYLKGHHGNPIVTLTMRLAKGKAARTSVEHLFRMLSPTEKHELDLEFERYLDEEENFYIRLDKQEAFKGKIKLAREEPIRIKIRIEMWHPTPEGAKEILRNLGMT
jgi:RNA binding exosome subunit